MVIKTSLVSKIIPISPVCDCGCVIKDLVFVRNDERLDGDMKPRGYFIPRNCPECNKKIKGVAVTVTDQSEYGEGIEFFGKLIVEVSKN